MSISQTDIDLSHIKFLDGAIGSQLLLQERHKHLNCVETLNLHHPDIVKKLHFSYLDAGSHMISTNSFCANSQMLKKFNLDSQVFDINYQASCLARECADLYSAKVAGSIGPGLLLPSLGQIQYQELVDMYSQQILALLEGGVDILLIETSFDILQIKATLEAAENCFAQYQSKVPIWVSLFIPPSGLLCRELSLIDCIQELNQYAIAYLGINCISIDDPHLVDYLTTLKINSIHPIFCQPNAGIPFQKNDELIYPVNSNQYYFLWKALSGQVDIQVWGGCCGTNPDYIKRITNN